MEHAAFVQISPQANPDTGEHTFQGVCPPCGWHGDPTIRHADAQQEASVHNGEG